MKYLAQYLCIVSGHFYYCYCHFCCRCCHQDTDKENIQRLQSWYMFKGNLVSESLYYKHLVHRLIGTHSFNIKFWTIYLSGYFLIVPPIQLSKPPGSAFCISTDWPIPSPSPELSCPLTSGRIQPIWGANRKSETERRQVRNIFLYCHTLWGP